MTAANVRRALLVAVGLGGAFSAIGATRMWRAMQPPPPAIERPASGERVYRDSLGIDAAIVDGVAKATWRFFVVVSERDAEKLCGQLPELTSTIDTNAVAAWIVPPASRLSCVGPATPHAAHVVEGTVRRRTSYVGSHWLVADRLGRVFYSRKGLPTVRTMRGLATHVLNASIRNESRRIVLER